MVDRNAVVSSCYYSIVHCSRVVALCDRNSTGGWHRNFNVSSLVPRLVNTLLHCVTQITVMLCCVTQITVMLCCVTQITDVMLCDSDH